MYSDFPQANRERYTFDAFVQSINDLGLHHQFLVRGVTMVKSALHKGEAYLLANQMHWSRGVFRQVEAELTTTHSETEAVNPKTTFVSQLSTVSKVAHVIDIVTELVAALMPAPAEEPTGRPLRPRARPPREHANTCWDCGSHGHFRRKCPVMQRGLNYRGPQELPPAAGRR